MPKKYCKVNGVLYELVEPTMATDEEKVEDLEASSLYSPDAKKLSALADMLCDICKSNNNKQARALANEMIDRLKTFNQALNR